MQDTGLSKNCLAIPKLLDLSPENFDQLDFNISNSADMSEQQKRKNYLNAKRANAKLVIDSILPMEQNSVILQKKALPQLIVTVNRKSHSDRGGQQSGKGSELDREPNVQKQQMSPFPYIPHLKQKEMNLKNVIRKIVVETQESLGGV